jgi:predicted tellurium resistance membrane protein TerC
MDLIAQPAFWASLVTLTFLEIVLGIDNLLFVSIAVGKLKGAEQDRARRIGIWGAMLLRIVMLAGIFWIINLDKHPVFQLDPALAGVLGKDAEHADEFLQVTVKDLILLAGGLFLLWKGTQEIHQTVEGSHEEATSAPVDFTSVVVQLFVINFVFSLDSVITAVGMTDILAVMIAAVVLSTFVMAFASKPLADFIEKHPTTKMLALAFILLRETRVRACEHCDRGGRLAR